MKKLKHVGMTILLEKSISFSSSHWNFCNTFGCIDGKNRQLKFLVISGFMILVVGVSDCLKVERGNSSATYVNSEKLPSEP